MSQPRAALRSPLLADAAIAAVCALFGGAMLVFLLNTRPIIPLAFVGGLGMLLVFYLSGNVRLCCLFGLIFVCPLDLGKRFMQLPHFGGEWAVRVDATDVFMAALAAFFVADLVRGRAKTFKIPDPAIWWAALAALAVVTLPLVFYRTLAVYEVIRMSKLVLLSVILANEVVRRRQMENVIAALFVGALIQSTYGLLQRFIGLNLPLERLGQLQQGITEQIGMQTASRVGAMLGHPNMLASYLILILPLAFSLLFCETQRWMKALSIATLLLGSATLIFTLSRASWLGYATAISMCVGISFLHPRLRYHALPLRIVVLVGLAAVVLLLSPVIIGKFTMSSPFSVQARWIWLEIAWKMIKTHPIVGVGLNAYTFVFYDYDSSGIPWGDMPPPVHNIYALTWAEQGIIGLALFGMVMLSIVRLGIKNLACKDNFMTAVSLGLWAGLCAVFVQSLADWAMRGSPVLRIFWVSVGLMAAVYYGHWQPSKTPPATSPES